LPEDGEWAPGARSDNLDRRALDTLVRRRGYDEKILAVLFRARERLLLAVGLATAKLRGGRI